MSVRLFEGFDFSNETCNAFGGTGTSEMLNINSSSASGWASYRKPSYLFHNRGIPTLNQSLAPPNASATTSTQSCFASRSTAGISYGQGGSAGTPGGYTGATTTTRAVYATAQGFQLGIVRNLVQPALTDDEYWFSFEVKLPQLATSSLSGYLPSVDWGAVFKWGDVALKCKETTYISGSTHDIVFSVINDGVEVATITVPNILCGSSFASNTWMFVLGRVRLHDTNGRIEFIINGNTQSSTYVDQDTVQTIAEADATVMYFGPAVLDNGTVAYPGHMDNILIDDTEWPAGIPTVRLATLSSDDSVTDGGAAGSSPTTVVAALTSRIDANHLRFSSPTGKAVINNSMPSSSGMLSDILAIVGIANRCANRSPINNLKIAIAMSLSGSESDDLYLKNATLPFSSAITPPETNGDVRKFEIFEKNGGGKYQTSELSSIKTVIKVTT